MTGATTNRASAVETGQKNSTGCSTAVIMTRLKAVEHPLPWKQLEERPDAGFFCCVPPPPSTQDSSIAPEVLRRWGNEIMG